MFSTWDDPSAADDVLRDALRAALANLSVSHSDWALVREEAVRTAIYSELERLLPGHVRKERKVAIAAFRGAGGSDLLVDRVPERRVAWLAETKWSYATPPKIFESVWDAVKLCLQIDEHKIARGWVITGAPDVAWEQAEGGALFNAGAVETVALWRQPLVPPRGPNYGATVGEDLVVGGNGNQPTRIPKRIHIEAVDDIALAGGDPWRVRAVAVAPSDDWIEDFAPPPKFPSPIRQTWLEATVPGMDAAEFEELLTYLRTKRWTLAEIEQRVRPLRPHH